MGIFSLDLPLLARAVIQWVSFLSLFYCQKYQYYLGTEVEVMVTQFMLYIV
jgi:hypothetical protein